MIRPYNIACMQTNIAIVNDPSEKEKIVAENLHRCMELAKEAVDRNHAKLLVYPEFFLQGFAYNRSLEDWLDICLTVPGPETDAMGRRAKELGVYMAGAVLEVDPAWPGRWFNCSFIISDEGKVILKYRKLNGSNLGGVLTYTTPGDVYDEYIEKHGPDSFFPVVDTPLGKLGSLICFDVNFPETARCLALNGAEVLIHPTGEPHGGHRSSWECARRARAYENNVYFCTANQGSVSNTGMPNFRSRGYSEILSYDGKVMSVCDGVGEAIISARIDIGALRYHRTQPGLNFLPQVRTNLYAPIYQKIEACPVNLYKDAQQRESREGLDRFNATLKRFHDEGRFVPWE